MRRVFWIALGAAAGVLVVRRVSAAANRWTPEGVAERAGDFWQLVRAAAVEREAELREALGLDGSNDAIDAPHLRDNR